LHDFYRKGRHSQERNVAASLQGKRIAIVATDDFEQPELLEPRKALETEGATVE
jgi:hypothetical protein